jgi:cytochrome c551/c552
MKPLTRFTLLLLLSSSGFAADKARGEAIFRSQCASCHSKPSRLTLPPGEIAEVLEGRRIPAHRLVRLGESDKADLAAFLGQR